MSDADSSTKPARITVYFFQIEIDGLPGPIKIGKCSSPDRVRLRLCGVQIGSPWPMKVLGVIPSAPSDMEERLHAKFASFRMRGEWFEADRALLKYIKEYADPLARKQPKTRALPAWLAAAFTERFNYR